MDVNGITVSSDSNGNANGDHHHGDANDLSLLLDALCQFLKTNKTINI